MKLSIFRNLTLCCATVATISCSEPRSYNEGVNIIPTPASMVEMETPKFALNSNSSISADGAEAKTIADFFAAKINLATGYSIATGGSNADIDLSIDSSLDSKAEGYTLSVTSDNVKVVGKDAAGLFYGMQSLMQLFPAEITSPVKVSNIDWTASCVEITDAPRFEYRGIMLDVCRHFMPVEFIKKQLDILSMFKINRMHWHFSEDQAWRIEIKKYPKLTEVGSVRTEPDGTRIDGFYTQDEVREIVAYAEQRFITVVPEFELPGHELAAIAAYPELSCNSTVTTPRIIWGVEDVVMCPGKASTFTFIEDVIEELVPLFPGEYFHVGGDECPKRSWADCSRCQKLIRKEKLFKKDGHSAEERLQSYVIRRVETMLEARGKKLIGWDEILEGGLSPNASVMSWRGEDGGIAAANMGRKVVMTPNSEGLYIDHYQGDDRIEPVSIGGYTLLEKTYSYDPIPKELVESGKEHFIQGVQANLWTEYMYTTDLMEYRLYPRALAVAEIGWSELDRKNFDDFSRRIENAYVRLDSYDVNYHIPQPEQPSGSVNHIAFVDSTFVEFKTTRPIKMVYTLDGSEPTPCSMEYTEPFIFFENTTLKIASCLPSSRMSPTRIITIVKENLRPAAVVDEAKLGLTMTTTPGMYLNRDELSKSTAKSTVSVITDLNNVVLKESFNSSLRDTPQVANVAEGYIDIPEDGVYYFRTNLDLWIDGELIVDNDNEVKRFSRNGKSIALAKGLHSIKVIFLGNIIGGWPSNWDGEGATIREARQKSEIQIASNTLFR